MRKKLKQQKGETLVESLVAMLIATLSVMMLTAAITGSARVNYQNRESDIKYAEYLESVEDYNPLEAQSVSVRLYCEEEGWRVDKAAWLYGGDGKLAAYMAKEDDES